MFNDIYIFVQHCDRQWYIFAAIPLEYNVIVLLAPINGDLIIRYLIRTVIKWQPELIIAGARKYASPALMRIGSRIYLFKTISPGKLIRFADTIIYYYIIIIIRAYKGCGGSSSFVRIPAYIYIRITYLLFVVFQYSRILRARSVLVDLFFFSPTLAQSELWHGIDLFSPFFRIFS